MGHPTRVHKELVSATLDYRAAKGDDGELLRDVGREIEGHLGDLGKKRGEKGAVKGRERGKRWQEVRELRKECVRRLSELMQGIVRGNARSSPTSLIGHKCVDFSIELTPGCARDMPLGRVEAAEQLAVRRLHHRRGDAGRRGGVLGAHTKVEAINHSG
jgi:hypothetical protein